MSYADATTDEQWVQPYKYNNKEYDNKLNLNTYDYIARQYDPVILRFTSIDPMAEKYPDISPYVYCANNPVRLVDPNGQEVVIVGEDTQQIADELNKSSRLNITYDPNNQYLSYTKKENDEYSKFDQELMTAIDDKNIMVRLNGVSTDKSYEHTTRDGKKGTLVFGSFEGSDVRGSGEKKQTVATQSIDITTSINAEKAGIDPAGHVVGHELLEAYYGARDFPGAQTTDKKAYWSSHSKSLDVLPLKISKTELFMNGEIKVSINGIAPTTVRPQKK